MARSGQSRAQANREIRQNALREQLASKGLIQQVIAISEKLQDFDSKLDQLETTRLKYAADLNLKLINKYLGDIKSNEHTGEDGSALTIQVLKLADRPAPE